MTDIDWRNLPSLSALRAFEATSRHRSFAAAARTLNVTHAAVAQQVRGLEKALGAPLVRRSGRSVALTDRGVQLAVALNDGFGVVADGVRQIRDSEAQRPLRITTTASFADRVILPRLGQFWARHPDIELSFYTTTRKVDLAAEGFDMAVRAGGRTEPGLTRTHLLTSHWIAVGAPALLDGPEQDISRLPWVWHGAGDWEQALFRSAGLDPDRLRKISLGTDTLEHNTVNQGLGLSFFTEIIARPDIVAGNVRRVQMPPLPVVEYYIVTPSGPHRPALDIFIGWLARLATGD